MRMLEVFNARAFRLALGFSAAISVATAAAFAFIYLQVSRADIQRVGAILVDEAAKSHGDSEAELRKALELRLTRDIRRLDFVALVRSKRPIDFRQRARSCRLFRSTPQRMSSKKTLARSARRQRPGDLRRAPPRRTAACFCWGAACRKATTCRRPCCTRWRLRSFPRSC